MTINSTLRRNDYVGSGGTGPFSYAFRIAAETDLKVTTVDLNNLSTTLTWPGDFSVTGVGVRGGGTITLTQALPNGYKLSVRLVKPLLQTTELRNQGVYAPETIEDAFDRGIQIDQQQQDAIDRSLKLAPTVDPAGYVMTLPAAQAGAALVWNVGATGFDNGTLSSAQLSAWSAAQNQRLDAFVGGTDFTAGTTTTLSLAANPGSLSNVSVKMRTSGVVVDYLSDQYTLSGSTLTFTSPIPSGTTRVEVRYFATYQINTVDAANATFNAAGAGAVTRSVRDKLRDRMDVRDFGADPSKADNTSYFDTAVTAAAVTGETLHVGAGRWKGTLNIPGGYLDRRVRIEGAGKAITIIQAATPNTPMLRASGPGAYHSYAGQFSASPHPSNGIGSGAALDLAGFTESHFCDIGYVDDGGGYFEALMTLSAWRASLGGFVSCYFNTIERPTLHRSSGVGMQSMIRFENDGTTVANNANAITIISPRASYVNGLVKVIDALRSGEVTIVAPTFEGNTGAVAIAMGQSTKIFGGYFEANVADNELLFDSVANQGTSNNCTVIGPIFASPGVITIPSSCQNNEFQNAVVYSKTFVDLGYANKWKNGNEEYGWAVDSVRQYHNMRTGGVRWSEWESATGGLYGAGARAWVDEAASKVRMVVDHLGAWRFFSGATGKPAIDCVPFDDATPTQSVLRILNANESLIKGAWMKDGSLMVNQLWSAQAQTATAVTGAVVGVFPVRAGDGTLIGYAPLYGAFTP